MRPLKPSLSYQFQQLLARLQETARTPSGLAMILLGAGFALSAGIAVVLAGVYLWGQLPALVGTQQGDQPGAGPVSLPTQACPPPQLALGERTFNVQPASLTPEGGLPDPPQAADEAYLLTGTGEWRAFLLGPAAFGPDGAALAGLAQAVTTDGRCSAAVYQLAPPQPAALGEAGLVEQAGAELAVFVQTGPDRAGFLIQGGVIEEQISPVEAATALPSAVQVEIGILAVNPSAAARLTQVKVSIYNFGSQSLDLQKEDVSLVDAAGTVYSLSRASPSLPRRINPGQTLEFELVVPTPADGLGTLRIFTTAFELADFVE